MDYQKKLFKYISKYLKFKSDVGGTELDKVKLAEFINSEMITNLVKPNKLALVDDIKDIKLLSKSVKKDDPKSGTVLSSGPNIITLCLVKPTYTSFNIDDIMSFINFTISEHPTYGSNIYINYSFTYTIHRGKNYNPLLRQIIEEIAKDLKICKILSVPLPGASSIKVLDAMGYIKEKDGPIYYKIVC
jgi:hypothetical protein